MHFNTRFQAPHTVLSATPWPRVASPAFMHPSGGVSETFAGKSNSPKEKPYPKPNAKKWFLRLVALPSRLYIRFRHNIKKVSVRGQETVQELLAQGHRVILTPNHPGHGDTLMTHPMYKAVGKPFNILVADFFFTNSFLSEKWRHRILNARGMFPLNREIPDRKALGTAIDVVVEGKHPLVVFPEGISTGRNDELGELKEGVGMIGIKAAEALSEKPHDTQSGKPAPKVFAVPSAMRHHFTQDFRNTLSDEIRRLERKYLPTPRTQEETEFSANPDNSDLIYRIEALGFAAIAFAEKTILGTAQNHQGQSWPQAHMASIQTLANSLATALGTQVNNSLPLLDQHRDLTGFIKRQELRLQSKEGPRPTRAERKAWNTLKKDTLTKLSILYEMLKLSPSYTLANIQESRQRHRLAEGLYRIEAILNQGSSKVMSNLSPRHTAIAFGTPIDISSLLEAGKASKTDHKTLRKKVMQAIKEGLETLLKDNGPPIPPPRTPKP